MTDMTALIEQVRAAYEPFERLDPTSPFCLKMIDLLDRLTVEQLKLLVAAKIKFVSPLAANRLYRATHRTGE